MPADPVAAAHPETWHDIASTTARTAMQANMTAMALRDMALPQETKPGRASHDVTCVSRRRICPCNTHRHPASRSASHQSGRATCAGVVPVWAATSAYLAARRLLISLTLRTRAGSAAPTTPSSRRLFHPPGAGIDGRIDHGVSGRRAIAKEAMAKTEVAAIVRRDVMKCLLSSLEQIRVVCDQLPRLPCRG